MLGRTYEGQHCSAARTLELVGERWSLLIIRDAIFRDMTRFSDFQRSLGLAPNVLTARLDAFVAAGLMERRPCVEPSARHEYVLTDRGRDLQPVILALSGWGDRWAAPDGPPILFEHEACGAAVVQQVVCSGCGALVGSDAVTARPATT
jgi:DNA-binding HxlR family transcriptional regulator